MFPLPSHLVVLRPHVVLGLSLFTILYFIPFLPYSLIWLTFTTYCNEYETTRPTYEYIFNSLSIRNTQPLLTKLNKMRDCVWNRQNMTSDTAIVKSKREVLKSVEIFPRSPIPCLKLFLGCNLYGNWWRLQCSLQVKYSDFMLMIWQFRGIKTYPLESRMKLILRMQVIIHKIYLLSWYYSRMYWRKWHFCFLVDEVI